MAPAGAAHHRGTLTVRRSVEHCIDLPDEFPEAANTAYMAAARSVLLRPVKSPGWKEFAGASNLIAWRFRGAHECWQAYRASLAEHPSPNHEENYRRERALFGMFTSGVSCIESASYSLAALASHPAVLGINFGPAEQRRCAPHTLRKWIGPYGQAAGLCAAVDALLAATEWTTWVELRNRMTHRSNLPRISEAWVGAPPPRRKPIRFAATSSSGAIDAEPADFDALLAWLSTSLESLLAAGATLP